MELGLVEGTDEGGRGKPWGAPWTDISQLTKSARQSAAHWECKRRQLTESAEYREILYQKQCGVEKRRGREIAEAKLGSAYQLIPQVHCSVPLTNQHQPQRARARKASTLQALLN